MASLIKLETLKKRLKCPQGHLLSVTQREGGKCSTCHNNERYRSDFRVRQKNSEANTRWRRANREHLLEYERNRYRKAVTLNKRVKCPQGHLLRPTQREGSACHTCYNIERYALDLTFKKKTMDADHRRHPQYYQRKKAEYEPNG